MLLNLKTVNNNLINMLTIIENCQQKYKLVNNNFDGHHELTDGYQQLILNSQMNNKKSIKSCQHNFIFVFYFFSTPRRKAGSKNS